ncbi:MAG: DciA family protein [Nodosilinea sp.]
MAFDSLARLIDEFEQQPNWHRQARFRQVLRHWSGVVGAVVAGQAIPVRLERQVLYVAVANAMWGQTLTLERLTILTRLNPQLGFEVKDIRFSPADWYHRASETPAPSLPQPSPLPDWLRHHPSFDARLWSTIAPPRTDYPAAIAAPDAQASFRRWASLNQRQTAQWLLCPRCHCPCPPGEMKRWSRCSLCAAKGFGQSRPGQEGKPWSG